MQQLQMKVIRENKRKYNILCVDDEENVLSALERVLRKENYNVYVADSGKKGLQILKKYGAQLIIADFRMPEMNGVEFLKKAKRIQPDAIRMLLSGYASIDMVVKAVNQAGIFKIISKPWSEIQLKREISLALEQWKLVQNNRKLNQQIEVQLNKLREMNRQLEVMLNERTREIIIKNQALELSHQILDNLPIPVLAIATEGIIVYMNRSAEELFRQEGITPIGQKFEDIFPKEVAAMIEKTITIGKMGYFENYSLGNITFAVKSAVVQDEFVVHGATAIFIET